MFGTDAATGPVVQCYVGKRGWMGGVGGCPNIGGTCIGCTAAKHNIDAVRPGLQILSLSPKMGAEYLSVWSRVTQRLTETSANFSWNSFLVNESNQRAPTQGWTQMRGSMDQQRFELLKNKYDVVLKAIAQQGVQLTHLHEENGKLVIQGKAPSEEAKNMVWDKIKQVDSAYKDLSADIAVDTSIARPAKNDASVHQGNEQTYTVVAGDTLSGISKHFYGEASLYMTIFEANRDKLSDPNKIQTGMQLRIPTAGKQVAS
ncbi:MAG: LysM peptidoglycan-binding domain-containing protein [Acidobacteriota bacterium]